MKPVSNITPEQLRAEQHTASPNPLRRFALLLHRIKQRITGADLVEELRDLSANPEFMDSVQRARTQVKTDGGLTTEELRQRLGLHQPTRKR